VANFQRVAGVDELSEGLVRVFTVDGVEVGVVKHEGAFYAFCPRCPHANYLMNYTRVRPDNRIFCSSHGAWFDLKTGKVLSGPTNTDLCQYEVRVEDDDVLVALDTRSGGFYLAR
jgi:nitrite reductase/ring-hydroxylating ferredoxin subunit